MNTKRTVKGYARAGLSAIMIEDQVLPKRCGHTSGKAVVDRHEALMRIQAAVDAKNELKQNQGDEKDEPILIMARTDAAGVISLDEAIWRAQQFHQIGADILFVEIPLNREQIERVAKEVF